MTHIKESAGIPGRFMQPDPYLRLRLLSARKEPGKYVEGEVRADNVEALFRSVPPPLSLAMTEKHKKGERAAILREHESTEFEVVNAAAERIAARRAWLDLFRYEKSGHGPFFMLCFRGTIDCYSSVAIVSLPS